MQHGFRLTMADKYIIDSIVNSVGVLTIHRPDRRNALDAAMLRTVTDKVREFGEEKQVHAIILTGDPVFSAGADIKEMASRPDDYHEGIGKGFAEAAIAMRTSSLPVISAIEGYAFGGGFMLALAADFVVLAEDCVLALPEIEVGLIGGIGVLGATLGRLDASRLVMLADRITAPEARQMGLGSFLAPSGDAMQHAQQIADRLGRLSADALAAAKKRLSDVHLEEQAIWGERDANSALIESPNSRLAMRSSGSGRADSGQEIRSGARSPTD